MSINPKGSLLAIALLAASPIISCARVAEGRVCAMPETLDVVAGLLTARANAVQIIPSSIEQAPTANPQAVLCGMLLYETRYDANLYGPMPFFWLRSYKYIVRRGRNGLFVEAVGGA